MVRILRAVDAAFERGSAVVVPPFSIELAPGERARLSLPAIRAAAVAARMACGIVKPTSGILFVGDFDPRIQPVQVKRMVGFVPHAGSFGDAPREPAFAPSTMQTVDFHAALYEVDRTQARRAARAVLDAAYPADVAALALALALIRPIALLVLDRPSPELEELALSVALPATAILSSLGAGAAPAAVLELAGVLP